MIVIFYCHNNIEEPHLKILFKQIFSHHNLEKNGSDPQCPKDIYMTFEDIPRNRCPCGEGCSF